MIEQNESRRYQHQMLLAEVGIDGQHKLQQARVLCVGAGGLGSAALYYLAAAGVGQISIVDADCIEESNLHRQILYQPADIGQPKALVAKARLAAFNPDIKIISYEQELNLANARAILLNHDLVLDASDNFATHYLLNDYCWLLKLPLILAAAEQLRGYCTVFDARLPTPCYRCFLGQSIPANLQSNCATSGVLGTVPGVLGVIQATEALKLILAKGQSLTHRLMHYDALSMNFKYWHLTADPLCLLCAQHMDLTQLPRPKPPCNNQGKRPMMLNVLEEKEFRSLIEQTDDHVLIDVREPIERNLGHLGGMCIPMAELFERLKNMRVADDPVFSEKNVNKTFLLYCQKGMRSQKAAELLVAAGFQRVYSLAGGMDALRETTI